MGNLKCKLRAADRGTGSLKEPLRDICGSVRDPFLKIKIVFYKREREARDMLGGDAVWWGRGEAWRGGRCASVGIPSS